MPRCQWPGLKPCRIQACQRVIFTYVRICLEDICVMGATCEITVWQRCSAQFELGEIVESSGKRMSCAWICIYIYIYTHMHVPTSFEIYVLCMCIVSENCWICHARQEATQSHRETIDELVNDLFTKLASGKATCLNHLISHVFLFLVISPSMQSVCETCFESAWSWIFS